MISSVSREPIGGDRAEACAVQRLETAEKAYLSADIKGSDKKTVRGEEVFKVIGAEFLSDQKCRDAGVTVVSAPASKRIPLIALSLKTAELPCISRGLASRIAGNWVSVIMFRRSLCCLLSKIFDLGSRTFNDTDGSG